MPAVTMRYYEFFKEIIANNGGADNVFCSYGVWNLKNQPVLYVCSDASYIAPDNKTSLFATFLDPTSIVLDLNKDTVLFDINDVDSIKLLAYDFAFADASYTQDNQPYYNFYGIPQDTITYDGIRQLQAHCGTDGYKNFLLDSSATYQTYTLDMLTASHYNTYTGVHTDLPIDETQMYLYNLVYTPTIGQNYSNIGGYTMPNPFRKLGVAVVMELRFKNGTKRIFADRFLPQIKAFSRTEAQALAERLQNSAAPTTWSNIPLEMPLFDLQKQKALRVLDINNDAKRIFSVIPVGKDYGVRIREYQNDNTPGLVIVIRSWQGDTPYTYYDVSVLQSLHNYLDSLHCWNQINSILENHYMPKLSSHFHCTGIKVTGALVGQSGTYDIENDKADTDGGMGDAFIEIYKEAADGTLSKY